MCSHMIRFENIHFDLPLMKYILLTCEETFQCIDAPREETNPSGWFCLLVGKEERLLLFSTFESSSDLTAI